MIRPMAAGVRAECVTKARAAALPATPAELQSVADFIDKARDLIYDGDVADRQLLEILCANRRVDRPGITYALAERLRILAEGLRDIQAQHDEENARRERFIDEADAIVMQAIRYLSEVEAERDDILRCADIEIARLNALLAMQPTQGERLQGARLNRFMRDLLQDAEQGATDLSVAVVFDFVDGGTNGITLKEFSDVAVVLAGLPQARTEIV